jgi:hypothetical protein
MSKLHVSHEALTFEEADGSRQVVKLTDFYAHPDQAPDRHGLLLWALFFQLVELNHRLGTYNSEKREGVGLSGMLAQVMASGIETSAKVGQLVTKFEDAEARNAAVMASQRSPTEMLGEAMAAMSAAGFTMPSAAPAESGNGSDGGA